MNINLIPIAICLTSICTFANASELQTSITVPGVYVASENYYANGASGYKDCAEFKGTHQLNSVYIQPVTSGGSGNYQQTLVWNFSSSYEGYTSREQQFQQTVYPGRSYSITLPRLRDDVPFVQQSVMLITKDTSTGEIKTDQKTFLVSRGVILAPTQDERLAEQNCFERYASFESTFGVLSNGSTNLSQLSIKQGVQKVFESTSGSNWGFYFSPLAWINIPIIGSLGNLITFNKGYFSSISKQTTETVEVMSGYNLSPGDFIQIYTQKTRYVTNYDATLEDTCGNTKTLPGAYKLQWWGFAYQAVPVNPYESVRPSPNTIGAPALNSCPKELSVDFGSSSDQFITTND
jgi:hypothetical protein